MFVQSPAGSSWAQISLYRVDDDRASPEQQNLFKQLLI